MDKKMKLKSNYLNYFTIRFTKYLEIKTKFSINVLIFIEKNLLI